jgi:hypothetical protein
MKHLGCTTPIVYFIFCPGKICTLHYTPLGILRIAQATYDSTTSFILCLDIFYLNSSRFDFIHTLSTVS